MTTDPADIRALGERLSNSGRWGPDDERGTLNFVTTAKTLEAARLIRSGRIVAASHTFNMAPTVHKPRPGYHRMLYREDRNAAVDAVMIEPHGYEITHIDALGHNAMDGVVYNGRRFEDVATRDGLLFGSVLPMGGGIVTRGVLLDIPRSQGRDWVEHGEEIRAADLDRAEAWAGITVGSGDALVVRTGLEAREAVTGPMPNEVRAGMGVDTIEWLHRREVCLFGGDCIDQLPSGVPGYNHPLHAIGLGRMGLVLVDHIAVEELGEACAAEGRWEFFFSIAALKIPKATGSAVNPLCIF